MLTVEWAFLCEHAFLDRSHRPCLISITDRYAVPSMPFVIAHVGLAIKAGTPDPSSPALLLRFITPTGQRIDMGQGHPMAGLEIAGEYLLFHLRNLPLETEGVYRFMLLANGVEHPLTEVSVVSRASQGRPQ